jgi:hypothetical protein
MNKDNKEPKMKMTKLELSCTSLDALAADLVDRIVRHAEYASEMSKDGEDLQSAREWLTLARFVQTNKDLFEGSLEAALDCLDAEQQILPSCPKCGGHRDHDPSGEVYCTECGEGSEG